MKRPLVDRIIGWFSPRTAFERQKYRNALALYEAAQPSRLRKFSRDSSAPNALVQRGAYHLRNQARHLEQNHDIARGILRVLVDNVVGPSGIGVEPQPRKADGTIHAEYAAQLREAWRDWCQKPEVTHLHSWAKVQRLAVRSWMRDGEMFAQTITGTLASLDHGTRVPYSLELFEADMVPFDYQGDRIAQGIERNTWGRPVRYFVYKRHPGEIYGATTANDIKAITADRVLHLAARDRIGQLRGVSEFASVITRLEDIKDYEESERVAAKIAAMLTGYVKRGSPELYDPQNVPRDAQGNPLPREVDLRPGAIIDSLAIGEEIGLIDSNRPNTNLVGFRQGQLRAIASGVGASYSSISRDYNGTYSAQRQELVEQWVHYACLADDFVAMFVQPVWQQFVMAANLSRIAPMPRDVVPERADDCLFLAQSMPWIDPLKEANAWEKLVQAGFASEVEVARRRGVNPSDLLEQISTYRQQVKEKGLIFTSDAANTTGTSSVPTTQDPGAPNE
jgi:lambda family phage portal protein